MSKACEISGDSHEPKALDVVTLFSSLGTDLQSMTLSFLTEAEILLLSFRFKDAVSEFLSSKQVINLSFLLQLFPNTNRKSTMQQRAVEKILELRKGSNLNYLECEGLRSITGQGWLPKLAPFLHTLDLGGCAGLNPTELTTFLGASDTKLKSLNLNGCTKVGNAVVNAIARTQPQLEALGLGNCSQSIDDSSVHNLLKQLGNLQHLGLQNLSTISDLSGNFMALLPESMESLNVTACKGLRLAGIEALEGVHYHMNHLGRILPNYWRDAPLCRHSSMMHLVLDAVGTTRVGLCRGIIAYFSMGRSLREVHLTGCESVQDWEIEALAIGCSKTLACFQMIAGRIGTVAIQALATHCEILGELDLSACFRVGDEAIASLAEPRSYPSSESGSKRSRSGYRLKVLRLSSLPGLTDRGIRAIGEIDSLHVLDVEDCIEVSPKELYEATMKLPCLIDVNAKGINQQTPSYASLVRNTPAQNPRLPKGLRVVNQRFHSWNNVKAETLSNCCSVRTTAQRLDVNTPLSVMYHCLDCNLVPTVDRGICASCVSRCHRGHRTYVGGWTRYYCDCPFGVAGNYCRAVFPE